MSEGAQATVRRQFSIYRSAYPPKNSHIDLVRCKLRPNCVLRRIHLSEWARGGKCFAVQIFRFLKKISSWFVVRLACFFLLLMLAQDSPRWVKGPLWFVAFVAGGWALLALARESRKILDHLVPLMQSWRSTFERPKNLQRAGKIIGLLCAAVILTIALHRAWPVWSFKATSSLREDEIMSVARFTSRGFVPAISTYNAARNHVFFNIVSSLIPGADSTMPLRARLVSFLAVLGSLALLAAYAARRGWFLPGLVCAGLLAGYLPAMDSVLEARGYGLVFLFAMLGCVAFCEWIRAPSKIWLNLMAVSCVLGTYTLPFYILFGGSLLLLSFLFRPSKDTFLAGFLSAAAIAMLYLPIVGKIYSVFGAYADRYETTFDSKFQSIEGVYLALQYFFPPELIEFDAQTFILLAVTALLYVGFGRFAPKCDRISFAGVTVSVLAFLAFCLYCRIVPMRVASYLAAPLAFLTVLVAGSLLTSRSVAPVRLYGDVLFTVLAVVVLLKAEVALPSVARADWRSLGVLIERAFPRDIRIWMAGDSPELLQWNLSSRAKPELDALDREAMNEGKLVAVEGFTKPEDEGRRFRWDDLPEGVRFVTSPISLNYHRVFFAPPSQSRIASITANDQTIETQAAGRQPSDPGLLVHSFGHGDVLRPKPGDAQTRFAQPSEIPLPATITVNLESDRLEGTCNLLFTQDLRDKRIQASLKAAGGSWRQTSNVFVLGELASIALDRPDCQAVRIRIESDPSTFRQAERTERPPFGLLEAWVAPGQPRLP